ncbi:MAG TPA: YdeI/OmpD-associated family protein [Puia sp.]|nr:YdeI/OmpD-associated family protein [Puia sp.]
MKVQSFHAKIEIIGINPFVQVPPKILLEIFRQSGKDKGPIPVCGSVNRKAYRQTLVKYAGEWRFYINSVMLKESPKRVGEVVAITMRHDRGDRTIRPHADFERALNEDQEAREVYEALPASRKKEIVRYISALKKQESIDFNIQRAIGFLKGGNRFVGRDKPR